MKAQLVRKLSQVQDFDNPKISLEQYLTPPQLAGDIIHTAYMNGDIEGQKIADFGTGTGIFAIGAAVLGGEVTAFEKDSDAIKLAEENAEKLGVEKAIDFVQTDIRDVEEDFDTVLMNPPFSVHSDIGIDFFRKAVSVSDAVYSVSHPGARQVIKDFVGNSNHRITALEEYKVTLPPTYGFHTNDGRETKVDVIITKTMD